MGNRTTWALFDLAISIEKKAENFYRGIPVWTALITTDGK
jgi:hypothetical protein